MKTDAKNYLRSLRCLKGFSTKEMADIINVSEAQYKKIEMEGIENMRIKDCEKIFKELHINPLELIYYFD